jgi:hypothetical protein
MVAWFDARRVRWRERLTALAAGSGRLPAVARALLVGGQRECGCAHGEHDG